MPFYKIFTESEFMGSYSKNTKYEDCVVETDRIDEYLRHINEKNLEPVMKLLETNLRSYTYSYTIISAGIEKVTPGTKHHAEYMEVLNDLKNDMYDAQSAINAFNDGIITSVQIEGKTYPIKRYIAEPLDIIKF